MNFPRGATFCMIFFLGIDQHLERLRGNIRVFSPLAAGVINHRQHERPLLLAIVGEVYDVGPGERPGAGI